MLLEIITG